MQDIEFTVERGKLCMLQTRNGKRTAQRRAADRGRDGERGPDHPARRRSRASSPATLDQLLHPTLDPNAKRKLVATGLPASPGAASGEIVFTADEAEALQAGRPAR